MMRELRSGSLHSWKWNRGDDGGVFSSVFCVWRMMEYDSDVGGFLGKFLCGECVREGEDSRVFQWLISVISSCEASVWVCALSCL